MKKPSNKSIAPRTTGVAREFDSWTANAYLGGQFLYMHLARRIVSDQALLKLAAHTRRGEHPARLLFAAVHYLLRAGNADHPLAAYYLDLWPQPKPAHQAFAEFRAFCLTFRKELEYLLANRSVQSNVVERCAMLLPAFVVASQLVHEQPLHLIEIGSSAGLNLLWHRYGYSYGAKYRACGDPESPVQIAIELLGDKGPPVPKTFPFVASRVGIDLYPVDVMNPDGVAWLRALVAPERVDSARQLAVAIELAQENPPCVIAGDGIALLGLCLDNIPEDEPVCIFHTFALQIDQHELLKAAIEKEASHRNIILISVRKIRAGGERPAIEMDYYQRSILMHRHLAWGDIHGRRMQWL